MSHAHRERLRPKVNTQGGKIGFSKLTEAQVKKIKRLLARGNLTHKEIGSQFGVARRTVSEINTN